MKYFIYLALTVIISSADCLAQDVAKTYTNADQESGSATAVATDWSGLYGGLQFGYGIGNSRRDFTPQRTTTGNFGINGPVGGQTVGYQLQDGDVVLGIEADFSLTGVGGRAARPNPIFTYRTDIPWFSTIRPRVGYALDDALLYLTGGIVISENHASSYTTSGLVGSDFSRTALGWTIGAGGEFALSDGWSVKGEYLYVRPGDADGPSSIGSPTTTSLSANIIRVGLNYNFGGGASTQPPPTVQSDEENVDQIGLGTLSGVELGGTFSHYRYQEHWLNDAEFMHETGVKFGPTVAASYAMGSGFFLRGDFRFSYSRNTYSAPFFGKQYGIHDYLFDTRLLLGHDWGGSAGSNPNAIDLAPSTGLGYRNLYNDARGRSTGGTLGYRRDSQYFYLPVGMTTRFAVSDEARISINAEYDRLIQGWQRSELSDDSPFLPNITNDQYGGSGVRGGIRYEEAEWSLGPYVEYWNISQSAQVRYLGFGIIFEPHNQTVECGLAASYRF